MATFYLGQRVRVVGQEPHPKRLIGREGVVSGPMEMRVTGCGRSGMQYLVNLDNDYVSRIFFPEELAPLTPPAADEWAQSKVRDLFKPTYIEPEKIDAMREMLRRYV